MPIQYTRLKDKPAPLSHCPKCGDSPFDPFLRGTVQSFWRKLFKRPYCCIICWKCKEIVGYENGA